MGCRSRELKVFPDSQRRCPGGSEQTLKGVQRGVGRVTWKEVEIQQKHKISKTMPHFTVTKVEDTEEGAAASVSQEETSLAEIKARTQHSDEPGKDSTRELLEPIEFFMKEMVTKIFKRPPSGWRKKYCG